MNRLLIIGGDSRIGAAVARLAEGHVTTVCRRGTASPTNIVVADYRAIPAYLFSSHSVVINCVGSTSDAQGNLATANLETPVSIAEAAFTHGIRMFVQLSSFSVLGLAPLISTNQPTRPVSAYGKSKLDAEFALNKIARSHGEMAIIRVPMLYGYGRSKVDDLLALWLTLRVFPAPASDVARSMMHYDLAAKFVLWIVHEGKGGCFSAADPEPFTYSRTAEVLRSHGIAKVRTVPVPLTGLGLIKRFKPALHGSLFADSLLSPDANDLLKSGLSSRLYSDIPQIARALLNDK